MKYYLVAGEASGDLHGANLMKALKQQDPQAEFRFFGGDLMKAEGGELIKHYSEMAYMGIVEVVFNIRTILRNMETCKKDILAWQPDALVLIDFPGFNLKIAEFAKKNGVLVCYYISPKVWAWNEKRVHKIKANVDHLFCILPFEVDFYKKWGMQVDYVGNPLLDAITAFKPNPNFQAEYRLQGKKIVALLPGSRKQEINLILGEMLAVSDKFPGYQFVVAGAPSFDESFYTRFLKGKNIPVVFNSTYDLLSIAEAAIVMSGTASLETALFHVPELVVYKGNPIFIAVARIVVKVGFISLINLILEKLVVKEFIQNDCTPQTMSAELGRILNDKVYRQQMMDCYDELDHKMGEPGASAHTAELLIRYASANNIDAG
jgi:lipid-A-disaccharide synthase